MARPLAVSMGDPAGVGLEIAARAWAEGGAPRFFLIADADAAMRAFARIGLGAERINVIDSAQAAACEGDALEIVHTPLAKAEAPGAPDPANAETIIACIRAGASAALSGAAAGLVTLPIAKAGLYAAGFRFPGHTEFVADLVKDAPFPARTRGPVMMLAGPSLRVALTSIHVPLREAATRISTALVERTGRVVCEALRHDFGVEQPRVVVCGLNPHAGESGALGAEEIEFINPAAARLRQDGWDVSDAKPADSLFHAEARAIYDAAIAMYHDQGLVPLKTLHFWDAANITLGLPIIRTSPDHGTGFDIAGRGLARADSFRAALQFAHDMARRRADES